jgi:hypothetical protein
MAKLIKKNIAKAEKPPESSDDDIERRDFFSEMKKREF